jgi:hypothetical protein
MAIVHKVEVFVIAGDEMGFRKPMDFNSVYHQIYMSGVELRSNRNDGYTDWEIKKDLYEISILVSSILEASPKFEGEEQWLAQIEQKKIARILGQ